MNRYIMLAAAALALATSTAAFADAPRLKVYGMLAYVAPLSETDQNIGGVTDAVKASSELGYNFGLEVRANTLLGIELDYLYAKHDIEQGTAGVLGETTFQPISATLNLHIPIANLDVYGGPTAAYVNWGDLKVASGGPDAKIDAEFAYGVSAGLDVSVMPAIAVTGGLRWLNVQAQPDGGGDAVDVNPLFARIGIAGRF